jgi:hypothetical protein
MVAGLAPAVDASSEWVGLGDDIDLSPIAAVAADITGRCHEWTDKDRDRFEGKASVDLYESLSGVGSEVLDDRGFWRYVGLNYFWEFIAWREEGPFLAGNYLRYVDASSATESVLTRMYLRAQAVGGSANGDLAGVLQHSTDFWRSHVLRVRTGTAPAMTRAFATKQSESRLGTDSLRETARNLNRLWTNVVLHTYDDDQARAAIDRMWPAPDDD